MIHRLQTGAQKRVLRWQARQKDQTVLRWHSIIAFRIVQTSVAMISYLLFSSEHVVDQLGAVCECWLIEGSIMWSCPPHMLATFPEFQKWGASISESSDCIACKCKAQGHSFIDLRYLHTKIAAEVAYVAWEELQFSHPIQTSPVA